MKWQGLSPLQDVFFPRSTQFFVLLAGQRQSQIFALPIMPELCALRPVLRAWARDSAVRSLCWGTRTHLLGSEEHPCHPELDPGALLTRSLQLQASSKYKTYNFPTEGIQSFQVNQYGHFEGTMIYLLHNSSKN